MVCCMSRHLGEVLYVLGDEWSRSSEKVLVQARVREVQLCNVHAPTGGPSLSEIGWVVWTKAFSLSDI